MEEGMKGTERRDRAPLGVDGGSARRLLETPVEAET